MNPAKRSRIRASDLLALGFHGLRARPARAVLSSLGIAIGIAAMVSVIGITTSSQALIKQQLAALGTNLLTVSGGDDVFGKEVPLPEESVSLLRRIEGVLSASSIAVLEKVHVYRSADINPESTGGLNVLVADLDLLETTGASLARGRWLNDATAQLPAVVLGRQAAERLGITEAGPLIWLGDREFTVVGILDDSPLVPELGSGAIIGIPVAVSLFDFSGSPSTVFERSEDDRVATVRELLPATINPESPSEVKVSRPSDTLQVKDSITENFTAVLVGVGSIALLVGGIGVANTMIISVLERRKEIGLRRALGATRGHIRTQFLFEAMLLSAYGGLAGAAIGWLITAVTARTNGWLVAIPPEVLLAGVAITVAVGAIAGVVPAVRAARTSPTAALSS